MKLALVQNIWFMTDGAAKYKNVNAFQQSIKIRKSQLLHSTVLCALTNNQWVVYVW